MKVKIDKTKKRIGLSDDHCGTENDWRDMMERPFWEKKGAVLKVCKLFYTAAIITSGCRFFWQFLAKIV
ncbi:MAG: hypothetical protein WAK17_08345 [Candidatus Nitrosopolaris sp.]